MKTFPMFLRMNGRTVVIAGGGEQAAQKCRLILKTEATIRLLAPALDPELAAMIHDGSQMVLTREPLGGKPPADPAGPVVGEGVFDAI